LYFVALGINSAGIFHGIPEMMDTAELFNTEHGKPFLRLLTFASDFETVTPEDRNVYQSVISYVGLAYKHIINGTESSMTTWRRLIGTASRNDARFIDFVEEKQPRAMAILAHAFACMKLIADEVPWFRGIAERQVPKILNQLPMGWKPMLAWPMAIVNGEVNREPVETAIDDILAL
jgi:hypothetical protein